jgi:hypothetical protein
MEDKLIAPVIAPRDFLSPYSGASRPYLDLLRALLLDGLPVSLARSCGADQMGVSVSALLPADGRNGPDLTRDRAMKLIGHISTTCHQRGRIRVLMIWHGEPLAGLLYLQGDALRVHLRTDGGTP